MMNRATGEGLDLDFPFRGRWLVQNSPADRLPSHGTTVFATGQAIDFVPVDDTGRTARFTLTSLLVPEPPQRFPGFGRALLSPANGTVVAVDDGHPDHPAHRGLPSLSYLAAQPRRLRRGWPALAGNHIAIDVGGIVVVLCHLRKHSTEVALGQSVRLGEAVAETGNSGNSTEPHLHIQAMDRLDPERAEAVPLHFRGRLPRNGEIIEA